jgi:hypothetical protein
MLLLLQAIFAKMPVAAEQDLMLIGAASQSALNNNILLPIAGVTGYDMMGDNVTYRSFSTQIVASGGISAGAVQFLGSNTDLAGTVAAQRHALQIYNMASPESPAVTAAQTIAASTVYTFVGSCPYRYLYCRITTAFTGGTVQATTKLSQLPSLVWR